MTTEHDETAPKLKHFDSLSPPLSELPQRASDAVRGPLYIVRVYDGFDNVWTDISGPLSEADAKALWNEKTEGGKTMTSFNDIDYYRIFPADTRMLFDGSNA